MFIRVKRIKNIEYAYLVKSIWGKKISRQKVIKYLGRVYTLNKVKNMSFNNFCEQEHGIITIQTPYIKIIQSLMAWTVYQHGFVKNQYFQNKWLYNNGKIVVDSAKFTISAKGRDVVLKMNEGYMGAYMLKELLKVNLNKRVDNQRQAATLFACAFVDTGITIPQNLFIELFRRIYI